MKMCKEFFSSLEEKNLHIHIKIWDDGKCIATGTGIFTFERKKSSPIHLKYVMFVPGLKKNMIYVVVLEDCGYDFIFSKGKSFL